MYLEKLINAKDSDYVKLLVGVRRSGKSTLLTLMQEHLISVGIPPSRIIEINFEMMKFDDLRDGVKLHQYIENKVSDDQRIYLFLDEVQEIKEWARVVNSLRMTFNVDIYATGSNANMFLGDYLTYLAGRYVKIDVYPLSYNELITFIDDSKNFSNHYDTFLESSFPSIVLERNLVLKNQLKQDIFTTIFERDIILRGKISREREFFSVARYILEHIGNPISINNIYNAMKSNNVDTSYEAVNNYLKLMNKSFFIYECLRYDVKGKTELKTLSKYYVVDFGIRNQMIPNINTNRGRVLENFIFLELIKHGYQVYTGKIGRDYEIDFIAKKDKKVVYIQVCESLIDPTTRERETRPFSYLKDNYDRIIVTFDNMDFSTNMYKHLNIFDFIKTLEE